MNRIWLRLALYGLLASIIAIGIGARGCGGGGGGTTGSSAPWTIQLGTTADDEAHGVATDALNNIYVAGWTDGVISATVPTGPGDLFVVKYNSAGVQQWARQLGTTTDEMVEGGVATDTLNNIYVAGDTIGVISATVPTGGMDLFVVKYNSAGVKQWARQLGSTDDDIPYGVATDTLNNIYVAGYTDDVISATVPTGLQDIFVVKYNPAGEKQWARQLGSTATDKARGVATDDSGNIYVAGYTNGVISATVPTGGWDLFVVKYDTDGTILWKRQLGSTADDVAWGVAIDTSGAVTNVYVAGYTWGVISATVPTGMADLFVVKYNSDGEKQWARQLGSTLDDRVRGVATDNSGNIYVAGSTFGGLDGHTNAGMEDIFVVKYNSDGEKQWTRQLGTDDDDWARAVATDNNGNIYVAGSNFVGLDGHTNAGLEDIFIVKYNSAGVKQ